MNATITTLDISWEMEQPTTMRCGGDLLPNTTAVLWCLKKKFAIASSQNSRTLSHFSV